MRRALTVIMAVLCILMPFWGTGAELAGVPEAEIAPEGIFLKLSPVSETNFTNVLLHYVYFDAEVRNAGKVVLRVYDPEGSPVRFRTRRHVDQGLNPGRSAAYPLKKGQEKLEGLNILFQSGLKAGIWTIEATAEAEGLDSVTEKLQVEIREPRPLEMKQLKEAHGMLDGTEDNTAVPVKKGRIRYVAQDPSDPLFVKEYWFSAAFDLRDTANRKCTRAAFSMALSWLGIDCTPVDMSDMLRSRELKYTYDPVCEKLGNVIRVQGDLETLWADYQAGKGSPVLLHFNYDGGLHAVLLIDRDREEPELFYAVNSGQRVNTSPFPDGRNRDMVIPIRIEKGENGQRIQSPLLRRYHRGVIDQIWQWKLIPEENPEP